MNVDAELKSDDNEFNRYLCSYLIENKDDFLSKDKYGEYPYYHIDYDDLLKVINSFTPP